MKLGFKTWQPDFRDHAFKKYILWYIKQVLKNPIAKLLVKDYPICVKNNKTMDINFVIYITKKFMYINFYINAQEIPG